MLMILILYILIIINHYNDCINRRGAFVVTVNNVVVVEILDCIRPFKELKALVMDEVIESVVSAATSGGVE